MWVKNMSKAISVISAIALLICGCSGISANTVRLNETRNVSAISETADANYAYTIQDVVNLQNFLVNRSTEENLKDKPYDLNKDGVWNVFDLCLMKSKISNPTAETNDTIVVYFSRTNNTEKIADYIMSRSAR